MTFLEFAKYLAFLTPVMLIAGVLIGIYYFRYLDVVKRNIVIYLILMLAVDLAGSTLAPSGNNVIILPVFSFIEMLFFVYLYNKYLLPKPDTFLICLGIAGALYIVVETLSYFVFNTLDIKQFQPYSKVVDNFIIIVTALSFYYQKMKSFKETKWDYFRFNTVILIFFTLNTIIFLPFNFLVNESSGVKFYFWTGNVVMLLLFYSYLISLVSNNGKASKNKAYKNFSRH
jgi:hypothetical protein